MDIHCINPSFNLSKSFSKHLKQTWGQSHSVKNVRAVPEPQIQC